MKEVIIASTYELKQISLTRTNTDKLDADKLRRLIKMQVLSGEQTACSVTLPPVEIQGLRSLFSTYRLYKKQNAQLKNRVHSLLREYLYGFTREGVFDRRSMATVRGLPPDSALNFQVKALLDRLERGEADVEALKERVLVRASPFIRETEILVGTKRISVFTAIGIIANIIDVSRFRNSKHNNCYLRSAHKVSNSHTSTGVKGANKQGRNLAAAREPKVRADPVPQSWIAACNCCGGMKGFVNTKRRDWYGPDLERREPAKIYQMLNKGEYHYA